jgi:hypothetical protein
MREIVWTATIDDNAWRVDVVRIDDYRADLQVYRVVDEELVHTEPVGLSYRAMFGPDADDVYTWQNIAIEVVDSQ